jgi:hypothetical protein
MQVERYVPGVGHLPGYLRLREPSNMAGQELGFLISHAKPEVAHPGLYRVKAIESEWISLLFHWCSHQACQVSP